VDFEACVDLYYLFPLILWKVFYMHSLLSYLWPQDHFFCMIYIPVQAKNSRIYFLKLIQIQFTNVGYNNFFCPFLRLFLKADSKINHFYFSVMDFLKAVRPSSQNKVIVLRYAADTFDRAWQHNHRRILSSFPQRCMMPKTHLEKFEREIYPPTTVLVKRNEG
jgi:hypothetical protein